MGFGTKWVELPGMTWNHEEPVEEEIVEARAACDSAHGRPPDAAEDERQQPRRPQYLTFFGPAPIPEATNGRTDDSPSPASGGVETPLYAERLTGGGDGNIVSRPPTISNSGRGLEEAFRRPFRGTSPSKVETRSNPGSSAIQPRS